MPTTVALRFVTAQCDQDSPTGWGRSVAVFVALVNAAQEHRNQHIERISD
jgi:galactokinase/mevalonate kinase-like predicted kinase